MDHTGACDDSREGTSDNQPSSRSEGPRSKLSDFLALLDRFDRASLPHTISRTQDDGLMITAVTPGRVWEVPFVVEGEIEVVEYVAQFDDIRTGPAAIDRILEFWEGP